MITATFTKKQHNGKIAQNRKEKGFYQQITLLDQGFEEIAVLRIYCPITSNATTYACLWVTDRETQTYISGGGKSTGYGYHRPSDAVANAFIDAGIKLSENIGGRGDRAMQEAMIAIAESLGKKNTGLSIAHA